MPRNFLIALVSFAAILTVFVFTENEVAPRFQACVSQNTGNQGGENTENKGPIIVGIIKAQAICSLSLVDRHNGFFAALAAMIVAAFTGTLWIATDRLAKSGQRIFEATERAFVFIDGFNFEMNTRADGKGEIQFLEGEPEWHRSHPELAITYFAMQPRWKNGGNTPTRNMTIQVDWRGPSPGPVPPVEYVYRSPPQSFFLAPRAIEPSAMINVPMAAAIVNWNMSPIGLEPLILIWGRADYEDIFGKRHFVEWCHQLRLSRTGSERMRASTIQWREHNRTDEDERT